MKYRFLIAALCVASAANAMTLNEAKKLFLKGEYEKVLPTFKVYAQKYPSNANYNQWYGACLYETGKVEESIKYLEYANSKEIAEAARYLAQIKLNELDYTAARDLIDEYESRIDNDDSKISEKALEMKERIKRATFMLNNVEKIQVIDSLVVDKELFFKHYRIAPEAGSLNTADVLPYEKADSATMVYMPESKSRMIWTMPDSTGMLRLTETYKLYGGKWDKYTPLDDQLNDGGDTAYPFLMADGATLYYAGNGNGSIGGYDIFMTRKNFGSDDYLQPQNLGMPYNSPYDDYLLVIDEMTNVGWWATDRNRIPGKVTIYVFIPNSIRENYDRENENISSLASLRSIKDTWAEGADYSEILNEIAQLGMEEETEKADFIFYVNNDTRYTNYEDFNSSEARSLMQRLMERKAWLEDISTKLVDLRSQFNKGNTQVKTQLSTEILRLERTIVKTTEEMQQIENNIRAAELPTLK